MTFSEYIGEYGLGRSEGVVLRYLAQAYRALRRTVPLAARDEELADMISWLGELVRGTDSSLLEEWEALAHPDDEAGGEVRPGGSAARGISAHVRGFTVMVRNALFRRVELAARGDYAALGELDGEHGFTESDWREAMASYFDEYDDIGTGPDARSHAMLVIDRSADSWHVRQIFDDPAGDRDFGIAADVDLAASDEIGEPVLAIRAVGPF